MEIDYWRWCEWFYSNRNQMVKMSQLILIHGIRHGLLLGLMTGIMEEILILMVIDILEVIIGLMV